MEAIQEDWREGMCSKSSTVTNLQVEIEKLKRENDLLNARKSAAAPTSRIFSMTASAALEELERMKLENQKLRASKEAKASKMSAFPTSTEVGNELEILRLEKKKLRATKEAKPAAASTATQRELENLKRENERLKATKEAKAAAASIETQRELDRLKLENERLKATKKAKTAVASATMQKEMEKLKLENEKLKSTKEQKASTEMLKELENLKRENVELKERKSLSKTERRRLSHLDHQAEADSQIRMEEIKKLVLKGQELDLAFLVDATRSMQSAIDMVKEQITAMTAGLVEAYPSMKLRVAFIAYRDYGDGLVTDECQFTDSHGTFIEALSKVKASGGGDEAEDVFSGLENVALLNWRSQNRLLFHIADAPCHGQQFHNGASDDHPDGDKFARRIEDLLLRLREHCQITTYFFCHLNESTKKMVQEFKKSGDETGDWIQQEHFTNINKIPHVVVTMCRMSIQKSMSMGAAGNPMDRKYVLEVVKKEQPNWNTIATVQGQKIKHKCYPQVNDLLYRIRTKQSLELEEVEKCNVKIAQNPFSSEGSIRWPYYAQVETLPGPPGHTIPTPPSSMVVKRFKTPLGKDVRELHKREKYFAQMEVQTVSAHMATEFNRRIQHLPGVKMVEFTEVSVLEVKGKCYNMEMLLSGEWIKYSNNGGYINLEDYAATLQAFMHWTYERSEKLLMVTDLQGVQLPNSDGRMKFCLCDPAIHCTDVLRFTKTNLGLEGFKLFFDTHKCNDVCKNLMLKPGVMGSTISGTVVGHR